MGNSVWQERRKKIVTKSQRKHLLAILVFRLVPAIGLAAYGQYKLAAAIAVGVLGFHFIRWVIPTKE